MTGIRSGKYTINAKGFILSVWRWGNTEDPLEEWGPIGYVPIDPVGNGSLFFPGGRGIPPKATHVWTKCVSHDFKEETEIAAEIASRILPALDSDPDAIKLSTV